jgi:hypothetical protein
MHEKNSKHLYIQSKQTVAVKKTTENIILSKEPTRCNFGSIVY